MSVRALLALRDGVDRECKRRDSRDFWLTFAAVFVCIFLLLMATWNLQPTTIRGDLDRLEQRVEELEAKEGE
jgi:fatty acid desaturase